MTTTDDTAYTVAELSQRWNCHQRTVRRLIDNRELPAFRLGRDWRVKPEAVQQFEAPPVTEAVQR